jgi:hypothetical protein
METPLENPSSKVSIDLLSKQLANVESAKDLLENKIGD